MQPAAVRASGAAPGSPEQSPVPPIATAPLRDCISYYNGHGEAAPGSLAYYGGGNWHKWRIDAQESMAPYVFGHANGD